MALKLAKAANTQAFIKACFYGPQGSGKTLTALLVGEMLAKRSGKRMAYLDTEHGTDFYAIDVKERKVHPKAFDFDRSDSRSVLDARDFLLNPDTARDYGVVVLDSVTHYWEAAKDSWTGKLNSNGQFPIQAWQVIKRPYKQLMEAGVKGNFHWLLCGRLQQMFGKDESGDMESQGTRVKAEGETGYEPHVLIRMFQEMNEDTKEQIIKAYVEKDRSGCLMGKTIEWPNADTFLPLLNLLNKGGEQGAAPSSELTAEYDAQKRIDEQAKIEEERNQLYDNIRKSILEATDLTKLKVAWGMTNGNKLRLGEKWDILESLKDARKAEIAQKGAA